MRGMSNCTHTEHPPCAYCRADGLFNADCTHGPSQTGVTDYEYVCAAECPACISDELKAHAAAAYERGRREAFEEAATYLKGWHEDTSALLDDRPKSPQFWHGVEAGLYAASENLRARAAEEGRDE